MTRLRAYDNVVLRLPDVTCSERRVLELCPAIAIQPFALMLWRSTPGSILHQLRIALSDQLVGPLPGLTFESEVGWNEFTTLLHPRIDGLECVSTYRIGRFFRFQMDSLPTGGVFSVEFEGGFDHGVVLARTPALELPSPEFVRVV